MCLVDNQDIPCVTRGDVKDLVALVKMPKFVVLTAEIYRTFEVLKGYELNPSLKFSVVSVYYI